MQNAIVVVRMLLDSDTVPEITQMSLPRQLFELNSGRIVIWIANMDKMEAGHSAPGRPVVD